MNRTTVGLLGAVAGLATIGVAHAAIESGPSGGLQVSSYSDLLAPVQDPVAALHAHDAARARTSGLDGTRIAEEYRRSRDHHHHHHHHHHHAPARGFQGLGGMVRARR
ncbi:MAG: hypothetical protein HIU82_07740 [Proteobacteria bacterium]|nr:hypothetical protein [Pseudomonadota bacterium]